jgi:hypothetical protein
MELFTENSGVYIRSVSNHYRGIFRICSAEEIAHEISEKGRTGSRGYSEVSSGNDD